MKRTLSLVLSLLVAVSAVTLPVGAVGETVTKIQLSDSQITVDGKVASTDETAAVYTAHDIVFYLEGQGLPTVKAHPLMSTPKRKPTLTLWFISQSPAPIPSAVVCPLDRFPWT